MRKPIAEKGAAPLHTSSRQGTAFLDPGSFAGRIQAKATAHPTRLLSAAVEARDKGGKALTDFRA